MLKIFLSYARADGLDAATRLRSELTAMGFTVWRDVEEMHGGQAWKEQLRAALRTVDAVVLLLTPGAVASKTVEWEWENALTLNKRVLPVLVQSCDVPAELKRLHYHPLNTPDVYSLGLARLVRDLLQLAITSQVSSAAPPATAAKYAIGKASRSAVGTDATAINVPAGTRANTAKLAQELARHSSARPATTGDATYRVEEAEESAVGDNATVLNQLQKLLQAQPSTPVHAAALQQTLNEIAGQIGGLGLRLNTLDAKILARFDQSEQTIMTTLVARLDEQDALLTEAILTAVEIEQLTAAELEAKVAAIHQSLALLSQQPTANAQYLPEVRQVVAAIEEPGLDVRHRLKLTIPLIPVLLSYEGEYEFNIRANLEAVWQALGTWVRERGK